MEIRAEAEKRWLHECTTWRSRPRRIASALLGQEPPTLEEERAQASKGRFRNRERWRKLNRLLDHLHVPYPVRASSPNKTCSFPEPGAQGRPCWASERSAMPHLPEDARPPPGWGVSRSDHRQLPDPRARRGEFGYGAVFRDSTTRPRDGLRCSLQAKAARQATLPIADRPRGWPREALAVLARRSRHPVAVPRARLRPCRHEPTMAAWTMGSMRKAACSACSHRNAAGSRLRRHSPHPRSRRRLRPWPRRRAELRSVWPPCPTSAPPERGCSRRPAAAA